MARVEFTANTARPAIAEAMRKLEGETRQLMLKDWGEYLLRSTRDRAKLEQDPDGRKWRALEPSYKRYKDRKRPGVPILKFDFHMLGDMLSWQTDGDDVLLVGTNAPYGAIHQFGGTIRRAARSTHAYFHRGRDGEVGNRFVPKNRSNFAQRVTVPEYKITIHPRPWLGVSVADERELLDIAQDHLKAAFEE
ncbi:phage virion morphogenesis protein [Xanthomonas campestris pv. trichodesmae]|uniref:Phage virion morphogenesis protein n=2 Tax=Xanthomonas citri TaxID=346 RepID=A0AB33CDG0_XANCI|nr:phage virion morphogenesis protein [Xanthomonas citri]ASK91058.1 phage virion morphogenesis protein [Xanthomonas citri pv. vignicola]MBV6779272.1 phage virion morphogenesis protein [Xanthomonas campestris pv. trichodesmae]MBZ3921786.1 phage morphogenesis protein [Xanthomonas campestris pv. trichodesmae]MBZ3926386.1 phage morphogenesis protein [Xanthomonas citri pv. sesbaniae]